MVESKIASLVAGRLESRRSLSAADGLGVRYASFKCGSGEREHHGRCFTNLDEPGLAALLRWVSSLDEVEIRTTGNLRPGRGSEPWLNTLLRRTG